MSIPVAVATPRQSESEGEAVRYPVVVRRDREADLSFRVGGSITAMPVRIGQKVASGTLLARIEATPYVAARVRANEDVARLTRAARRAQDLVPAGAVAPAAQEDAISALRAARATLESARYDETSASLRAPFSGIVLSRQAEVGETVAPGQSLLRMADLNSAILAKASVPEDVAARLRVGSLARVDIPRLASLTARVRRIGAAADLLTGTVEVELVIPTERGLPSGLTGSVAFELASTAKPGLCIPAESLLDAAGGKGHVFVVDPARRTARRVEVGLLGFDGEMLRVTGLAVDARVITYGAGFLRDGQRVELARQ